MNSCLAGTKLTVFKEVSILDRFWEVSVKRCLTYTKRARISSDGFYTWVIKPPTTKQLGLLFSDALYVKWLYCTLFIRIFFLLSWLLSQLNHKIRLENKAVRDIIDGTQDDTRLPGSERTDHQNSFTMVYLQPSWFRPRAVWYWC